MSSASSIIGCSGPTAADEGGSVISDAIQPGWFPDPTDPTILRYWDGAQWTAHTQPAPPVTAPPTPRGARRAWIASGIAVGVVAVLAVGVAVAWAPVSAALFPTTVLSEADFYQQAEQNLRDSVPELSDDPLAYVPGGNRGSRGYLEAASSYIDDYLASYGASEREFASLDEAEEFAYSETLSEFNDLALLIASGGEGLPFAAMAYPTDPAIVAIEQEVANWQPTPDADGSYWAAGNELAARFGSTLTTDLDSTCPDTIDTTVAGFFCGTEENWDDIFITPFGMESVRELDFIDLVKHELAHKLMATQCRNLTGFAVAWNDQYGEGVTNSYAVAFLGADPARLSPVGEYEMNETTDAKAREIHESDLACF